MKIVWHTIPEYPEYEINRLGQIRRKSSGRVLKPFDDRRGYLRVNLNGQNVKVHLLVAKMFVPNPHGYPVVDHKRGDSSVDVTGLGEITIKQSRPAYQFSFSSFFPPRTFPGITNIVLTDPQTCVSRIKSWIDSDKPVHIIITGAGVNAYCTIEKFSHYEKGGDVGTVYYDLSLKEYREVTIRQVTIQQGAIQQGTVAAPVATVEPTQTCVDNTVAPKTYTVKKGDCLWNIAKSLYGSGADYSKIFDANKGVIGGNPNRIYPGQVLTIP